MVNAQEWLNKNYPKETKEIYINEQLENVLSLENFNSLEKIFISCLVDESKFEITNRRRETKIVNLKNAQQFLNQRYPLKQNNPSKRRSKLERLNIDNRDLEGNLDLTDFTNLKKLCCNDNKLNSLKLNNLSKLESVICSNNQLINLEGSGLVNLENLDAKINHLTNISSLLSNLNPKKLRILYLTNNNFSESDLTHLSKFINLEHLEISNRYNQQDDTDGFYRSLKPLQVLINLESLYVLDANSDREIYYSTNKKSGTVTRQIKQLISSLKQDWKDINSNFTPELQKQWEDKSFGYEECKKWIDVGLTVNDADFADYWKRSGYDAKNNNIEWLRKDYANCLKWKSIHPDFTPRLQKLWELHEFTIKEVQQWINQGLVPEDYDLVSYLKKRSINPEKELNLTELRKEYANNLDWGNIYRLLTRRNYSHFGETYQKRWEKAGFAYDEVKLLIENGLRYDDYKFATYLKKKNYQLTSSDIKEAVKKISWQDIHRGFTSEWEKNWKDKGFTYEQTKEWVNVLKENFEVDDFAFCAWLRDEKNLTFQEVLQNGNSKELKEEYKKLWTDIHEDFAKENWSDRTFSTCRQKWEKQDLLPKEAREWIKIGFEPHNSHGILVWKESGFSFQQIKEWMDIGGFKPSELGDLSFILEWINHNFDPLEAGQWKQAGLTAREVKIATYAKSKGYQTSLVNVEELRKEYRQVQNWLDFWYPKNGVCRRKDHLSTNHQDFGKKRSEITELNINNEDLVGNLDLSGFENLTELNCKDKEEEIERRIMPPKYIKWKDNQLDSLDLSGCNALTWLDCHGNQLTSIEFLACLLHPKKLTYLNLNYNKIQSNLEFLKDFTNLEGLELENNGFYGSLEPLKNMSKLYRLYIDNTDVDSGLEYLPESLKFLKLSEKIKNTYNLSSYEVWVENNQELINLAKHGHSELEEHNRISKSTKFENLPQLQNNLSLEWKNSVSPDLQIEKVEEEFNLLKQSLKNELIELVEDFIQVRKKMLENEDDEEVLESARELEEKLKEKGFAEEKIEEIIRYCEKLVALEQQQTKEKEPQTEAKIRQVSLPPLNK